MKFTATSDRLASLNDSILKENREKSEGIIERLDTMNEILTRILARLEMNTLSSESTYVEAQQVPLDKQKRVVNETEEGYIPTPSTSNLFSSDKKDNSTVVDNDIHDVIDGLSNLKYK